MEEDQNSNDFKRQREIYEKVKDRVLQLADKYAASGQDLVSYLDGLLYANYLTYWDYIHLDTLLSLQNPRTDFPDEEIFILYHQITELYFKSILSEIKQIATHTHLTDTFFYDHLHRINRYWAHLVSSFDIMVDGMDVEQFLKFRMSLLPASGFQSAQFRKIEICTTDFYNLVGANFREQITPDMSISQLYDYIYWKRGATEVATGKKTLTLEQFEKQYSYSFILLGQEYQDRNLYYLFRKHFSDSPLYDKILKEMRIMDSLMNVDWGLAHYKSAVRYLQRDANHSIDATGGTNWQKYLPPRFQKQISFPELWTEQEKAEWGKHWVIQNVGRR